MPIQTNLKTLQPARDRFKKEITLLSKGYSMKDKIPGGKITIFPWDQTVDDWVIRNLKKIKMAMLPFELVKKVTNLTDVSTLPTGDVNTILLVAKAAARDFTVTYESTCPTCGRKDKNSVKVPDQLGRIGEKPDDYPGWDEFKLPACGDLVRVRPLLVRDEIQLLERPEDDPVPRRVARAVTHLISVNGGQPEDAKEAVTYFQALQPSDFDFYMDKLEALEPHLGTEMQHKCDDCGTIFSHNLSLDADFFR